MRTEKIPFEMTDTFNGEANYAWCRRGVVEIRERGRHGEPYALYERRIVRAVKRALGLSGVRCIRRQYGDVIGLRPVGSCVVVFIG
jgi:hypothetical protein